MAEAFAARRSPAAVQSARILYGSGADIQDGTAGPQAPISAESQRVQEAVADIRSALSGQSIELPAVGPIPWDRAFGFLKRIVAATVDSPALRYLSVDNFQVSHIGFWLDHADAAPSKGAGTIYLYDRLLRDPEILRGVLYSDVFELAARGTAKIQGIPWTQSLAKEVHDRARLFAQTRVPDLTDRVQQMVQTFALHVPTIGAEQARQELLSLGLSSDQIIPEFLPQNPLEQQIVVNRISALLYKGIPPNQISPALVAAQGALDRILETEELSQISPDDLDLFTRLNASAPELFNQIAQSAAEFIERAALGEFLAPGPAPAPHSQISGLALRLDKKLGQGQDYQALLSDFKINPESIQPLWDIWTNPEGFQETPELKTLPRSSNQLFSDIKDLHRQIISQEQLLKRQEKRLASLAKKHPLVHHLTKATQALKKEAAVLRSQMLALPKEKAGIPLTLKARDDLRAQRHVLKEQISLLQGAADFLEDKTASFQSRLKTPEMVALSLLAEWHPGAQGLSVSGDYLWLPEGKNLDALLISKKESAPEEMNPEILEEFLPKDLDVTGTHVGSSWLRTRSKDWYRNRILARHAFLGINLWGTTLNGVVEQVPIRELWPWIQEQMSAAETEFGALGDTEPTAEQLSSIRNRLQFATSLLIALQLEMNSGKYDENFLQTVLTAWLPQVFAENPASPQASQKNVLLRSMQNLRSLMAHAVLQGRRRALEKRLEDIYISQHPAYQFGQLGLLGTGSLHEKPAYLTTAAEARRRVRASIKESKSDIDAQKHINATLKGLSDEETKERPWENYPEEIPLGKPFIIDRDAFGRPIEVTVHVGKTPGPLQELALIAPLGLGRYEAVIEGAVFEMDPMATRAILRAFVRHFHYLKMEGYTLNEAREAVNQELDDYYSSPERTDREVIAQAITSYEAGVWLVDVPPASSQKSPDASHLTGPAMSLAQAFSDFAHAPQNKLTGEVLIAWADGGDKATTRGLRTVAEKMSEVFAGNNMGVQLSNIAASSNWMFHSMGRGRFSAGFLVTETGIQIFGHDRGSLPEASLQQIRTMQALRTRAYRMNLATARMKKRIRDVVWWEHYRTSLYRRFRIEQIQKAGIQIDLDTPRAEEQLFFSQLGLLHSALDLGGSAALLGHRVRSGTGRLGAVLRHDGPTEILDSDGLPVPSGDLALVLTDYLLRRGYPGAVYRASGQSRFLDRLAREAGRPLEIVDDTDASKAGTGVVLSPLSPWNDTLSQVLLAMEVVAIQGKGLKALANEIRERLGPDLQYQTKTLELPQEVAKILWDSRKDPSARDRFIKLLGVAPSELSELRFADQAIEAVIQSDSWEGWLHIKRSPAGLEIQAEASGGRATHLVRAAEQFTSDQLKDVAPTWTLRAALALWTLVLAVPIAFIGLSLFFPHVLLTAVAGIIDLGSSLLGFFGPPAMGVVGKALFSGTGRLTMTLAGFFAIEFFIYWYAVRWPLWNAYWLRERPLKPLDRSLTRFPILTQAIKDNSAFYYSVGIQKDLSLGIIRERVQRLRWKVMQPLFIIYQALTIINKRLWDDKTFSLRQPINAKARLLVKAIFLEPSKNLWGTWVTLWKANWAPIAGMGFPTHLSPPISAPLPESLDKHVRAVFGTVVDISDADTWKIRFSSGEERWGRAIGLQAVENDKAGSKRAKKLATNLVRGQKVLFLIPQVEKDGMQIDQPDEDDYSRFLFDAYTRNKKAQWENTNRYILNELHIYDLANVKTGLPASYILDYYILDIAAPEYREDLAHHSDSLSGKLRLWGFAQWDRIKRLLGKADPPTQPAVKASIDTVLPPGNSAGMTELQELSFLEADTARSLLKAQGGRVHPTSRIAISRDVAGPNGELLAKKTGRVDLAAHTTLLVSGRGIRTLGNPRLEPGASLVIETPPDAKAAARVSAEGDYFIDGDVQIKVEEGALLVIREGTRITGRREIVVPAGSRTILASPQGHLEVRNDSRRPKKLFSDIWKFLTRGGGKMEDISQDPFSEKLDFADLIKWWKRSQEARYDPVSIPQRSTKAR
ncbi:MAG: hypothetical protein HY551_07490, partial [Elusimicrobia bacterium]|nr:hypothetical protein [Elusimicrobiota bacterium]